VGFQPIAFFLRAAKPPKGKAKGKETGVEISDTLLPIVGATSRQYSENHDRATIIVETEGQLRDGSSVRRHTLIW